MPAESLRPPFHPTLAELPATLPIFPLPGALLLPRARLPLNIFEPRYLAMVLDALGSGRLIGMIQPVEEETAGRSPATFSIGCAGRISSFEETADGRLLIVLTGVARFRVAEELPLARGGYRRIRPDWSPFATDLDPEPDPEIDRSRLFKALKSFLSGRGVDINWKVLEAAPDLVLVATLTMICPLDPTDKQALLEAPNTEERAKVLIALLEIAGLTPGAGPARA